MTRQPSTSGYSTKEGYTNPNKQMVVRATSLPGTDHRQRIYVLVCGICGYEYGANGSDIHRRRCPSCQDAAQGLDYGQESEERTPKTKRSQGRPILTLANIDEVIVTYLGGVRAMEVPPVEDDLLHFIRDLKRKPIKMGPHEGLTLYEAFNRTLSDLVILFGVRKMLLEPLPDVGRLPYTEFDVALGNTPGFDVQAEANGRLLLGEAFDVAQSYYPAKMRESRAKLIRRPDVEHRVVIFNIDARSGRTVESSPALFYLPVDVPSEIEKLGL